MLRYYFLILLSLMLLPDLKGQKSKPIPPVSRGQDGKLIYNPDSLGDRTPDFSYCGYMAGEQPIPDLPVKVVVPVQQGDATMRIQAAIDYVSSLPSDKNGFKGAVLLEPGDYEVWGSLKIASSGVVLRGSGMGENGTRLIGSGLDRQTLIRVAGKKDIVTGGTLKVNDSYVPVNAMKLTVESGHSLKAGDHILIYRPSTKEWIQLLKMEEFGGETGWIGWKPGSRDLYWDRTVVSVNGEEITFDAPITTALDANYGGGNVISYQWPGRIAQVGIENFKCISTYDESNPKDEAHRWMAITMENISDSWVRQVTFEHFAGSAVAVYETAKRITVQDCKSLSPVSEIGGQRRYTFLTEGQQTLFQRLYAEYGYHDFAAGFRSSLNAFVQCDSHLPYSFSGTIDSWASGILFDVVNIDGQALRLTNRHQDAQGAGWTAANSVLWECAAALVDCYKPPTANNWAYGIWARFSGDCYWENVNDHMQPRSLYATQLQDRLGEALSYEVQLMPMETKSTSSPTVEQAMMLTKLSKEPPMVLSEWIDSAPERNHITIDKTNVPTIDKIGYAKSVPKAPKRFIEIKNGHLQCEDAVLTGNTMGIQWWRGNIRYYEREKAGPHITRFVPGRVGTGWTDDLEEVVGFMHENHIVAIDHHYGLWYERRRDDHERVRRMDGEVWPPFYELPFARSGKELSWDGLSKYDLTKYNPWYWNRLKQFADLADQKGFILMHQNYFQHNIIEAGAHWADFPWRSANNINNTGFPEPPPYAGDKRIFMAEQFYDITNPVRRELHRAYIRQCLNNFDDNQSVIQLIGDEYTGPLHFVEFWIDVIAEWEKETGKHPMIALSVTKDVQDAILADAKRSSVVDLIDIRYWHLRSDGTLYEPKGGQNLAPRQHARLVKPGNPSFESAYQSIREYREKYPEKAVMFSAGSYDRLGWAIFMAGGSLPNLPQMANPQFLKDASDMKPFDLEGNPDQKWAMKGENGYIVYNNSQNSIKLDLTNQNTKFVLRWIDPENGNLLGKSQTIKGGKILSIDPLTTAPVVLWLIKK